MAVELTAHRRRADAGALPGRVGIRRARRRPAPLRGLRLRRADRLPHADVVDHPLAPLEDADPVPGAPLPRARLRRARQRSLRPAGRARRLPRGGICRRRARGDGRNRHRTGGARLAVAGRGTVAAPRRVPAGAGREARVHRAGSAAAAGSAAERAAQEFEEPLDEYVDWGKWNRHYWVEHYEDFLEFFFSQCFTEPHSTKPREDAVGWGLETDAETLVATQLAPRLQDEESVRELLSRIRCPVLVIHGSEDAVRPCASGARLAELAGGELVVLEGSGHLPTRAIRSR